MHRKNLSDSEVRMSVRAHLAQYRIDLQRIQLRVFGGAVRVAGEAYRLGGHQLPLTASALESFERDVLRTRGVRRASFEFLNWKRSSEGVWEPAAIGKDERNRPREEQEEVVSVFELDESGA